MDIHISILYKENSYHAHNYSEFSPFFYKKMFYKFAKAVNYQIQVIIKHTKCVSINEGNMFGSLMKLSRETGPIPDNLIKSFTASSNKLAAL